MRGCFGGKILYCILPAAAGRGRRSATRGQRSVRGARREKLFHYILFYPIPQVVGDVVPLVGSALRGALGGKRALVVGGTKGIGRAVALSLAKSGAR